MFYKIKVNDEYIKDNTVFTNGSGFYLVEAIKSRDLVYFNKITGNYFFIEPFVNVPIEVLALFEKAEPEKSTEDAALERTLSEGFVLKMLSITMNKEKFKDVNP